MSIKILVVEDDARIQDMVCKFLRNEGWLVDACANGDDAANLIYDKTYQLIILDIMLPGTNGQELLKELRQIRDTPVSMILALSSIHKLFKNALLRYFRKSHVSHVTSTYWL